MLKKKFYNINNSHTLAQDAEERKKWVKCLEETILKNTSEGVTGAFDNFAVNEEELNRKMQEAEAYFRILTQQVKVCCTIDLLYDPLLRKNIVEECIF